MTNNGIKKQCALLVGEKTVCTDAECPALDVVENKCLGSVWTVTTQNRPWLLLVVTHDATTRSPKEHRYALRASGIYIHVNRQGSLLPHSLPPAMPRGFGFLCEITVATTPLVHTATREGTPRNVPPSQPDRALDIKQIRQVEENNTITPTLRPSSNARHRRAQ